MNAQQLYEVGDLDGAIAALNDEIKKNPRDLGRRAFLADLLCFAGSMDRADSILNAISTLDPGTAVGVALYRQLVRAETSRKEFFQQGRPPEVVGEPDEAFKRVMEAALLIREGKAEEATAILAAAEEQRVKPRGTLDGKPFDDFRDIDDLMAGHLEVLTSNGKYYLIPIDRIESIEFHKPKRARDLLWRPARMVVRDGPDGEIYLPCLYAGAESHADARVRLGRITDWVIEPNRPVRGVGLRTFLVGEESATILEMNEIAFEGAAG